MSSVEKSAAARGWPHSKLALLTMFAALVVAGGWLASEADAATNDFQSDPDCYVGNGGDYVTRAVDGWRFWATCTGTYGPDVTPVVGGDESDMNSVGDQFDGLFVSDEDMDKTAAVKFFCPEPDPASPTGENFTPGTLRGLDAAGNEVWRLEPVLPGNHNESPYGGPLTPGAGCANG